MFTDPLVAASQNFSGNLHRKRAGKKRQNSSVMEVIRSAEKNKSLSCFISRSAPFLPHFPIPIQRIPELGLRETKN